MSSNSLPGPFLFGASMYPEVQDRRHWKKQLKAMRSAGMDTVRLADSSWGNLEPEPGRYNFGWLHGYLAEVENQGMKAILGTGTYLPPQWLSAGMPDILCELRKGEPVHPMSRKACCLHAPEYLSHAKRFLRALGASFASQPAVIAWQIDNEIDALLRDPCFCKHCEAAWTRWLEDRYHTPQRLNEALGLRHWGMEISDFQHLPLPRKCHELLPFPPAPALAFSRFLRDYIMDFLRWQTVLLREQGVTAPFLHDWMHHSLVNDPAGMSIFDIAGLNIYPSPEADAQSWAHLWIVQDMARTGGKGSWIVTETTTTACGSTTLFSSPRPDQFRCWMLQAVAFGARGILFWSGNQLRGGHWPYWGGLFDWSENPQPELQGIFSELGRLLRGDLKGCPAKPVLAKAAALSDYEQRSSLKIYPHTEGASSLPDIPLLCFRRLGIAVDVLPAPSFARPGELDPYEVIFLMGVSIFNIATDELQRWVENGGLLVIGPIVSFQHHDGVFREDGPGSYLAPLSGCKGSGVRKASRGGPGHEKRGIRWVDGTVTPLGLDGWQELMDVGEDCEVLAHFECDNPTVHNLPAVSRRPYGKGEVLKLAAWPEEPESIIDLIEARQFRHPLLSTRLPSSLCGVPWIDGSLWIINPVAEPRKVQLAAPARDLLRQTDLSTELSLGGYDVVWVQARSANAEE